MLKLQDSIDRDRAAASSRGPDAAPRTPLRPTTAEMRGPVSERDDAPLPLKLVTFGSSSNRVLPFQAGRPLLVMRGGCSIDTKHKTTVLIEFMVDGAISQHAIGAKRSADAVAEARRKLAEVRDKFDSPPLQRFKELTAKADELRRQVAAAQDRPGECLARARQALLAGQPPEKHEADYRTALAETAILQNRLEVFTVEAARAHNQAAAELKKQAEAVRQQLEAEAVANAERLAAEMTAAVAERLEDLRAFDDVATFLTNDPIVFRHTPHGVAGADEFKALR